MTWHLHTQAHCFAAVAVYGDADGMSRSKNYTHVILQNHKGMRSIIFTTSSMRQACIHIACGH
jgi:hypothetical protein